MHALLLTQWIIRRRRAVYARWREFFGAAAMVHFNLVVVNLGESRVQAVRCAGGLKLCMCLCMPKLSFINSEDTASSLLPTCSRAS